MGVGHHALDITKLVKIKKVACAETQQRLIDSFVPTHSDEVVGTLGSPDAVTFARQCLQTYEPGKRCMAICGSSGLGKTVLGRLLLQEHGYTDCLEIDLVNMQLMQPVGTDKTVICRLIRDCDGYSDDKPLLLDGAESPAWVETSGISALSRKRSAPTIVVCDETRKARSRTCLNVVLRRPRVALLAERLHARFPQLSLEVLTDIVEKARCDIRHVFQNVESALAGKHRWGGRDEFLDGNESITQLFAEAAQGKLEVVSRLAGIGDSHALVFENYLDAKSKNIHDMARAAEWMSVGDMVENRLYHQQSWSLYDFRLLAGSVAPATCVGRITGEVKASTQRGRMSKKKTFTFC